MTAVGDYVTFVRNAEGHVMNDPCWRIPAEPICPVCDEPVRWCLDMFSLTTGTFGLDGAPPPFAIAHARCVWTKQAFDAQKELAS